MSRILNRQRQLAEQGRIRLGYTTEYTKKNGDQGTKPVRSETFILTSHSKNHMEHAASLWGGTVEHWQPQGNGAKQYRVITNTTVLPAILPPGDPLTQAYEMWSRGGCQRRCDGVTEQFSGSPCICLAEHGDTWFELGPRDVCVTKSRLKVLLPDMEGLGSWRMETGSFYATDEIAGMVDTIRGAIGDSVPVPVNLRIEQRTRIAGGETKHFVVPVLELRGVTAGALLSGEATAAGGALASGRPKGQAAITSGPAAASEPDLSGYYKLLEDATTSGEVMGVFEQAKADGILGGDVPKTHPLYQAIAKRGQELAASEQTNQAPAPSVGEEDPDVVWQQVLAAAGKQGMSTDDLMADFAEKAGVPAGEASAGEMRAYLQQLGGGAAA